jgi:hypothetical protein
MKDDAGTAGDCRKTANSMTIYRKPFLLMTPGQKSSFRGLPDDQNKSILYLGGLR